MVDGDKGKPAGGVVQDGAEDPGGSRLQGWAILELAVFGGGRVSHLRGSTRVPVMKGVGSVGPAGFSKAAFWRSECYRLVSCVFAVSGAAFALGVVGMAVVFNLAGSPAAGEGTIRT